MPGGACLHVLVFRSADSGGRWNLAIVILQSSCSVIVQRDADFLSGCLQNELRTSSKAMSDIAAAMREQQAQQAAFRALE